jgi:GAF domain-containing protein
VTASGPADGAAPLALAERYYAAFNARDMQAWLDTLDEDVQIVVDAGVLRGRPAALQYVGGILQAYPGVTVAGRRVVAVSGDAVVSEFQLANPALTAADDVPPDGSAVPWRLDGVTCEVLRLRGDRLVSLHSYYSPSPTDRTPTAAVPSRAEAARIAHRQAALNRVATEVAEGGSERDLVTVINQVIAEIAGVDVSVMIRFEPGDGATLLAVSESVQDPPPVGQPVPLHDDIRAVRDCGHALRFAADGWPLGAAPEGVQDENVRRWWLGVPILRHGTVWGVSLLGSTGAEPLGDDIDSGITAFTHLVSTALSNAQANDELQERAREQSALREVAEIAAAGADPVDVFAAVVRSASSVLDGQLATLIRFVDDDVADVLAFSGPGIPPTGKRIVIDPVSVTAQVLRTGRPARIDDYRETPGNHLAGAVIGLRASAGVPVTVGRQLWGMLAASSVTGPLPADVEARLSLFAQTVATAIAGAQARAELRALADEQAALRGVAELVARGAERNTIYAAVTSAAADIVHETATLIRCDESGSRTVVASSGGTATPGIDIDPVADEELVGRIIRTRLPYRVERYSGPDDHPDDDHLHGLTSRVGVPIIVGDRLWGVLTATASSRRLLTTTEQSLHQFAGLMAAAMANAEARGRLQDFADQQAALRRVAELAAHDAPPNQVLQAVAVEASGLAGVAFGMILQYEGTDGSTLIVGLDGAPENFAVGMRAGPGDSAAQRVWRTGRPAHVDDLGAMPGLWPRLAHERGFTCSAGVPIVIHGALWGAVIVVSDQDAIPGSIEEHLSNFADLAATAISAAEARAELRMLADEQAALRRVAELAAHEAPAEEVLAAAATEASSLAGVDFSTLLRFEPDGSTVIVALAGGPPGVTVGMRAPGTGDGATQRVWRTGKPARIDNLAEMSGAWPVLAHRHGYNASAAVPVVMHGGLWGALVVVGRREAFPKPIEEHLANFADLAGTAVSAADARQELHLLANEQAAVRRVAELVARGGALEQIFDAVAAETSAILGMPTSVLRYDDGAAAVVLAGDPDSAISNREVAVLVVPVTVEGRAWGALTATVPATPMPPGIEQRLTPFAELTAVAIANADNKAKLTASRARVIATADETRRRVQRDVHDGAQQRLVHTIIVLKMARDAAMSGQSPAELLDEALTNAERASKELRDIVRGILPASLTRGGLRSGLESLVSDLALPVDLAVDAPRLSPPIETTAYFIVAEAMTNVVKHAGASRATVDIAVQETTLVIDIGDDGRGGADPRDGTGLTGLLDRVEAGDGTLTVTSPPGRGTVISARLPLDEQSRHLLTVTTPPPSPPQRSSR